MIDRMTLILESFDSRGALTLEEVTCRSGLPRSTVHRILDQLVGRGWIDHASFGYCLGARALGLGGSDTGHRRIREAAAPHLHELALQTGAVVHLTVLDGNEVLYLDKVGGQFASSVPSRVGGRFPAYATASGKAILAWLEPERVDALYGKRLPPCTDRTIGDNATLHQELNRIRKRRGVAFEREEAASGIGCVGVALRGVDGPVAALSLAADARSTRLEWVAPIVADAARKITRTLFPDHDREETPGTALPASGSLDRVVAKAAGSR
ncbi:IclR family transcriptional regulator [Rhodococcus sp. BL-253-APC-6A1W]|nr:IclR family transcriptional regulator [Rhodococcus sp. (in: high G+C Gram-positive bacteria)]NMD97582.1 IclR family transcriptional regulator [Rhodococcus sp. BL-253-APC-6A1W]NME81412.1 IclR family transcriptional regulator [Rhodococcus sp. 105337]